MIWLKIAGIAIGVFVAFAVLSTVLGYLIWIGIAALVVGAVVLAVKAGRRTREVGAGKADRADREVTEPAYTRPASRPAPRPQRPDVDDELARLKREMGS